VSFLKNIGIENVLNARPICLLKYVHHFELSLKIAFMVSLLTNLVFLKNSFVHFVNEGYCFSLINDSSSFVYEVVSDNNSSIHSKYSNEKGLSAKIKVVSDSSCGIISLIKAIHFFT